MDPHGCTIFNYDYEYLAQMSYSDALLYTQSNTKPETKSCIASDGSYMQYHIQGTSIVPEVINKETKKKFKNYTLSQEVSSWNKDQVKFNNHACICGK